MQAAPSAGRLTFVWSPVRISGLASILLGAVLSGPLSVSLGPSALAETAHRAACRDADPDTQIAGCTEIIARGKRETTRNRITAYINRGGAYRAKGDLDLAIADYDKAIAAQPQSATAFHGRGEAYRAKGDNDRAIMDYNRALDLDRNLAAAYAGRAEAYRGKGDNDRALVDYDAAIERDPDRAGVYMQRGTAFSAKGEFDKAIADFSKTLELDPLFAEALVNRADAYRTKQDLGRARQDLESATRLDPRLAAARAALEEVDRLIAERTALPPQALLAPSAAPSMKSVPDTPATLPKEPAPTPPAAPSLQSSSDRSAHASPLTSKVLFHIGPVPITTPVVTTWAIIVVLGSTTWLVTRRLQPQPNRRQAVLEVVVTTIMRQIEDIIRKDSRPYLPLLGTLFLFLVVANLVGLLPGGEAPTSKLETPAALALIVFFSVHFFGVRARGLFGYLASFAEPKLVMLPLNIVSEVTRTFSLMVRLFGNVMSGEFVIALVVGLAGFFVPIPLMVLEILVGIVQAYIFTVLATVFIGAAIGSVEKG